MPEHDSMVTLSDYIRWGLLTSIEGADDPDPDPDPDPKKPKGKKDPDPDPDPKKPKGKGGSDDDEPFDKDRALETIRKQRESEAAAIERAKELEAKVKDFEDRDKSESQKLEERATGAETRATAAERKALQLEVALDKAPEGMSIKQVRKLAKRLSGEDREALEADAEELFEEFVEDEGEEPRRRPRERLRPGAAPGAEPEETDPAKLAKAVPRSW